MRQTLVVAGLVLRTWSGDVGRSVGGGRSRARALLAAVVVLALGWVVLGTRGLVDGLVDAAVLDDALRTAVVGQLLVASALSSLLVTTVALLLAPARGPLDDLLAVLPVRPAARRLGVQGLVLAVSGIIAAVVTAPYLVSGARVLGGAAGAAFLLVAVVALLLGCLLAALVATAGTSLAVRALRWPLPLGRVATAFAVVAAGAAAALVVASPSDARRRPPGLLGDAAAVLAQGDLVGAAVVVAVVTATLGAVVVGLVLVPEPPTSTSTARTVPLLRPRRADVGTRSTVHLELLQWLRSPVVVSALALLVMTLGGLVVAVPRGAPLWSVAAPALLLAAAELSTVAYGTTRSHHWVHAVSRARAVPWAAPKVTAVALACSAAVGVVSAVAVVRGGVSPLTLLGGLPLVLMALGVAFLVGVVVPVDGDQSMSATTALLGSVLAVAALTAGMSAAGLAAGPLSVVPAATGVAAVVTGLLVARARERESVLP